MKMRRFALSCRWLSSAILSVATLSMALLSARLLLASNTTAPSKIGSGSAFDGPAQQRLGGSSMAVPCKSVTSVVC